VQGGGRGDDSFKTQKHSSASFAHPIKRAGLDEVFQNALVHHARVESISEVFERFEFAIRFAFFDGNGRMARLLANLPVLNAGLPPIVVPQEDRYRYKRCLSDYQNTVDNLPDLSDLSQLPDNPQKQQFTDLCQSYWTQTIELLDQAKAMQQKRHLS
jgi:Fic family protein